MKYFFLLIGINLKSRITYNYKATRLSVLRPLAFRPPVTRGSAFSCYMIYSKNRAQFVIIFKKLNTNNIDGL